MSRIQEAIRKAAREQQFESGNDYTTAESILSASHAVAAATRTVRPSATRVSEPLEMPDSVCLDWHPDKKHMLFGDENMNPIAREQFRSLRMKLSELREQKGIRTIAVGSALPGDGKTFVSVNLAQAFAAQRDSKVLLIDCDMRRGSAAGLLGARTSPGLSEYLLGEQSLQDVLQRGTGGSLSLISSGRHIAEPGELVTDVRMKQLIQQMRSIYDWIVIDTPPVIQFSDARVLAGICDGTLLVVKASATPVQMAQRAADAFKAHCLLGTILNRTDTASSLLRYYAESYTHPQQAVETGTK
jgi:protein-tyrosine kinase